MVNLIVTHEDVTGAAANPNVLVDGPKWDKRHVVTGAENVDNTSDVDKPVSAAQATALALKADAAATTASLALKANLASPALTGTPTAPTASVGTNTTQLATTAFVLANGGSSPGTLLASNNLSDVASAPASMRNLGGFDLSTTVAVTGTTTLTSSGFGKLHLLSGTSASYTVTIPTPVGNTGALMAFMVDLPANASKLYTLSTPSGVIGRQGAGFVMWASETVVLRSNGTNWQVLDGKPVPFTGKLYRVTNQTGFSSTFSNVLFTAGFDDPSGLYLCFSSGVFTAPRKGSYSFTSYVYATQVGGTSLQTGFGFDVSTLNTGVVSFLGTVTAGTMLNFGQHNAAAGEAITIQLRGDGTSLTAAGASVTASMTYLESPSW